MGRKTNFAHIAIQESTKRDIDKLKLRLEESYGTSTYDELMKIFLEKNKKLTLPSNEVKRVISKSRGVMIWINKEIYFS